MLGKECLSIEERFQIKKHDLNRQLCRKLRIRENLDIGCREYRKPFRILRKKFKTYYKQKNFIQNIGSKEIFGSKELDLKNRKNNVNVIYVDYEDI